MSSERLFGALGLGIVVTLAVWLIPRRVRIDPHGVLGSPRLLNVSERLAAMRQAAPDIAAQLPLAFDPELSNPCWREASSQLRCLPAFFVAGGMQCGVTDMWHRLSAHAHIGSRHDALSHWWTNHPRSRAGDFARYTGRFSVDAVRKLIEREPRTLLGDASPATFSFMMAESLRLHYLFLDAYDACWRECRSKTPPPNHPKCREPKYNMQHCYTAAQRAMVPVDFNLPAFAATILPELRMLILLREPAERLWIAYWTYGQYPARYGQSSDGFGYYFGNQSAHFQRCVERFDARACALRFESHGAEQASVYYHCDQVIKGLYAIFLQEWQMYFTKLLVLRTSDYFRHPVRNVRRVWRWLGLRQPRQSEVEDARSRVSKDELTPIMSKHPEPPSSLMLPVRRFYAPYNRALALLLNDNAFVSGTWEEPHANNPALHSTYKLGQ